jgi:DNA (cytosine-5)-methyltransferase 1
MHKGINTTVDEGQTPIIELPEVMCTLRSSGAGFDRPGNAATEHETYLPTQKAQGVAVRRLTPRECERLQGFPDDYTDIPWRGKEAPDGPRYKALGNSMAVPVMRWIGKRIQQVEKILDER